jgi:hypothetical protein
MTDEQKPDLDALKTSLLDGIETSLRQVVHAVAAIPDAEFRKTAYAAAVASGALSAVMHGAADRVPAYLFDLDAEQLRDVVAAANLLAERADARHAALTTIPETETR